MDRSPRSLAPYPRALLTSSSSYFCPITGLLTLFLDFRFLWVPTGSGSMAGCLPRRRRHHRPLLLHTPTLPQPQHPPLIRHLPSLPRRFLPLLRHLLPHAQHPPLHHQHYPLPSPYPHPRSPLPPFQPPLRPLRSRLLPVQRCQLAAACPPIRTVRAL